MGILGVRIEKFVTPLLVLSTLVVLFAVLRPAPAQDAPQCTGEMLVWLDRNVVLSQELGEGGFASEPKVLYRIRDLELPNRTGSVSGLYASSDRRVVSFFYRYEDLGRAIPLTFLVALQLDDTGQLRNASRTRLSDRAQIRDGGDPLVIVNLGSAPCRIAP